MILILYRITTLAMVRISKIENLLEGEALCVVQDGLLIQKDFQKQLYAPKMNFFGNACSKH